MSERTCEYCGKPLDSTRRSDTRFCNDTHRVLARKRRLREERDRARAAALGVSLKKYREVLGR